MLTADAAIWERLCSSNDVEASDARDEFDELIAPQLRPCARGVVPRQVAAGSAFRRCAARAEPYSLGMCCDFGQHPPAHTDRDLVLGIVNRYEGHVGSTKRNGLLAVFGDPKAHENDVRRAALPVLEINRAVERLSDQAKRRFGIEITVRVGVHRGTHCRVCKRAVSKATDTVKERVDRLIDDEWEHKNQYVLPFLITSEDCAQTAYTAP